MEDHQIPTGRRRLSENDELPRNHERPLLRRLALPFRAVFVTLKHDCQNSRNRPDDLRHFYALRFPMPYWKDKVAVITGGSGGLGKALAGVLAAAGAKVIIVARDAERLAAVAAELSRAGGTVLAMPADVTQQDQVDGVFGRTIEQFGRLDLLVNSAGARRAAKRSTPLPRSSWSCST